MDLTHPPAGPAASERPRASSVSSLGIEGGHRITRPPGSFASPMHTRTRRFSKPGPRPPGFVSRTATYHTLKDQKRLVEDQLRELQDTSSLTKLQKRVRSNVLDSEILMIEGEIAQLMAGSDCTTALESAKAACPHLQYADSFLSHLISQQQEPPAELPQDQLDVLSPLARTPSVLQVGLEVNLMVLRRTPSDGGGRLGESPMGSRSAQEGFEQPAQAEHEVFHGAYSPQSYATKKEMEVSPRTEMKVDSKAVLGIVRRLSLDTEPCVLKRTDSMEEHCALLMSKLDAVNDDGTRPSMQELAMGMGIYTTLHDSTGFGTVDAFAANDESRRWERASSDPGVSSQVMQTFNEAQSGNRSQFSDLQLQESWTKTDAEEGSWTRRVSTEEERGTGNELKENWIRLSEEEDWSVQAPKQRSRVVKAEYLM